MAGNFTAGDVYTVNGKNYTVDSTGVLVIPVSELADGDALTVEKNHDMSDPRTYERLNMKLDGNQATLSGILSGDVDLTTEKGIDIVLDNLTITGTAGIYGDYDVVGTLTISSTGSLTTDNITIENGESVSMSDNAKFTFVNLTVKAGGQISNTSSGETTIVEATTDVEIAVDVAVDGAGTINGAAYTGGLMGAIVQGCTSDPAVFALVDPNA